MKKLLFVLVLFFISNQVMAESIDFNKNKYNLNDPALNKCFKKILGEDRYQEVIVSGAQKILS